MEITKPLFLQLEKSEQKAALESLIFASEEPITIKTLFNILVVGDYYSMRNGKKTGTDAEAELYGQIDLAEAARQKYNVTITLFDDLINEINEELLNTNRPYQIIKVANGFQYCTRKEYGELIHHLNKSRAKKRFSQAALETLAIVAYKQPVTKPEIDQIRGVGSGDVVNTLVEKGIIEIKGRKEALGKPLLYGTTNEFLKIFGLNAIEELPKLRDMDELAQIHHDESNENDFTIDISSEIPLSEAIEKFKLPELTEEEIEGESI